MAELREQTRHGLLKGRSVDHQMTAFFSARRRWVYGILVGVASATIPIAIATSESDVCVPIITGAIAYLCVLAIGFFDFLHFLLGRVRDYEHCACLDDGLHEEDAITLRNRDFEIDLSWGDRKYANPSITQDILASKRGIFVAGIGLRTVSSLFLDDTILTHFADEITNGTSNFVIRVIACDEPEKAKRADEIEDIAEIISQGKDQLIDFVRRLEMKLTEETRSETEYLDIRTYPATVTPRHSIIRTDDYIYVGSYLHNREGLRSYMIRLRINDAVPKEYKGLFRLFDREIEHLLSVCTEKYKF